MTSSELSGYLGLLLAMPDQFNPYPFRRGLLKSSSNCNSLRGGSDVSAAEATNNNTTLPCSRDGRVLVPTRLSYALDLQSQSRFGSSGVNPFGLLMSFSYEFCVDDGDFVGEYHDAFVDYLSQSSNLNEMASDIRNLGLSSTTSVSTPETQTTTCIGPI